MMKIAYRWFTRALFAWLLTLVVDPAQVAAASERIRVEIVDLEFVPNVIRAKPGDVIEFVNKDFVPHTATHDQGAWDSGTLEEGDSWTLTLGAAGDYAYYCHFHPTMTARIVVE